jgi:hypothetical protein
MGRTGRYALSVMVWVAAFAGWSGIVGLVVAAFTGDAPGTKVASGISAAMYVVLSAVPTVAAVWFNDWARDGFPSAEERRRGSYPRADVTLRDRTPTAAVAPAAEAGETEIRSWSDYAAGAGGTTVSVLSTQPLPRDAASGTPGGQAQPPSEAR